MCLDDTPAAVDIFYMLQCIAPGMFQIVYRDDRNDRGGELETVRSTPRLNWMSANKDAVKAILGSEERTEELMKVSNSVYTDLNTYGYEYDEGPGNDFAACSAEDCGWCGNCHY